jgi:Pyruvate/2-oxoacid:ferredoxin oxidoreductase delta subunit
MRDSRPVWLDHCTSCFACLHWCPEQAVGLGGAEREVRPYHHPEVSLSDMLRRA